MKIVKDQRYRTQKDIPVIAMISWSAPFSGGYDRILPAEEEFTILHDPVAKATAVYCRPKNYWKLHSKLVPWRDRLQFWFYRGYHLCISLNDIEENCDCLSG